MQKRIATWSETHDCWLEYDDAPDGLFSVPSVVWSETFPRSAMWDSSGLYELPTSEPRTGDSGTSSLPTMPTPTTRDRGVQGANVGGGPELNTAWVLENFFLPPSLQTESVPRCDTTEATRP